MQHHVYNTNKGFLNNIILTSLIKFFTMHFECILFCVFLILKLTLFNETLGFRNYPYFEYSCFGSVIIALCVALWFKRKMRVKILLLIDMVFSLIILSNVIYFRYYNDVISIPVLFQISLLDPAMKSSVANLIHVEDIKFVIDIVVFFILAIILSKKEILNPNTSIKTRVVVVIVLAILGGGLSSLGFVNLKKTIGDQPLSRVFDHSLVLENTGLINFYAYDIWYYAANKCFAKEKLSKKDMDSMKVFLLANNIANPQKSLSGVAKGKNLIVVQVESMQNIVINMKINGREVTPNLNSFIKKSIYFNNYYTQVGQGNTADAEFISNNSFYSLPEGAVYFRSVNNTFNSLPKQLMDRGYSTAAMHAYKASFWNRATIYPRMGFQNFFSQKDYNLAESVGWWGLTDKSFLKQSVKKMLPLKQPFYSFLITLSSHYPYESFKKNQYKNEFDSGMYNGTFFGDYLKAMNYADESLGTFFDELEKNKLLDSSIVVIYGDHEGLKQSDLDAIRRPLGLSNNDDLAFLSMKKVPLIIHLPYDYGAGERNIVGGQVDLLPTLENLLGFNSDFKFGRDLINSTSGEVIFRNGNVTNGEIIYLKNSQQYLNIKSGKHDCPAGFKKLVMDKGEQMMFSDKIIENDILKLLKSNKIID